MASWTHWEYPDMTPIEITDLQAEYTSSSDPRLFTGGKQTLPVLIGPGDSWGTRVRFAYRSFIGFDCTFCARIFVGEEREYAYASTFLSPTPESLEWAWVYMDCWATNFNMYGLPPGSKLRVEKWVMYGNVIPWEAGPLRSMDRDYDDGAFEIPKPDISWFSLISAEPYSVKVGG